MGPGSIDRGDGDTAHLFILVFSIEKSGKKSLKFKNSIV